jgi:hypothetical protein
VADTSPQKPETPDFLEAYPPPWLPAGSLNRAYSILIPRFVLPSVMHDKNRMRQSAPVRVRAEAISDDRPYRDLKNPPVSLPGTFCVGLACDPP